MSAASDDLLDCFARLVQVSTAAFTALGCFVEIIAFAPRVFVPVDKPDVLTAVLAKRPVQRVLPKAA